MSQAFEETIGNGDAQIKVVYGVASDTRDQYFHFAMTFKKQKWSGKIYWSELEMGPGSVFDSLCFQIHQLVHDTMRRVVEEGIMEDIVSNH